ncbi:hypothetical protein LWF01_03080 [Saxibacter everestensis]|uniref:DUF998 domain-containing protein n=1 Tax=Saxibacter everestensis TaxID=2909229 RepID=A0ABY8QUS7_9MICO|nr:hypothetical protein LWF01_03080 [Brevibacteriaceae bacterium ZFBP1038]
MQQLDHGLLADRIERIEAVLIRSLAFAAGLGIGLGLLLPYLTWSVDQKDVTSNIVATGFLGVTYRTEDGDIDGPSLFIGIAFIGLSLVGVLALCVLVRVAARTGSMSFTRWANAIAALLLIGVVGAWLFAGVARRDSSFALHSGIFFLTGGAMLFAFVIFTDTARRWWVLDR